MAAYASGFGHGGWLVMGRDDTCFPVWAAFSYLWFSR